MRKFEVGDLVMITPTVPKGRDYAGSPGWNHEMDRWCGKIAEIIPRRANVSPAYYSLAVDGQPIPWSWPDRWLELVEEPADAWLDELQLEMP